MFCDLKIKLYFQGGGELELSIKSKRNVLTSLLKVVKIKNKTHEQKEISKIKLKCLFKTWY
mgnify:CR=1 FL=1